MQEITIRTQYRQLNFHKPAGTSRGKLHHKDSWFIMITGDDRTGIGECSVLPGLSPDYDGDIVRKLEELCLVKSYAGLDDYLLGLSDYPAIRFAVEMAKCDLGFIEPRRLFESSFLLGEGIPINGLVWMGNRSYMYDQIKDLISREFSCIKLKIAAIDFDEELDLIKYIRSQFNSDDIEIRVDANGGFGADDAMEKLKRLSDYDLHSIEQPIAVNQYEQMSFLCAHAPLDIALDEELIRNRNLIEKETLLATIKPAYLILKPSLLGGFAASEEWIALAEKYDLSWWVTSALEANIGLNAIAQWTATLDNSMKQGLGTGSLFSNNIPSPLLVDKAQLFYGRGSWGNPFEN